MPEVGYCRDCKWWVKRDPNIYAEPHGIGICLLALSHEEPDGVSYAHADHRESKATAFADDGVQGAHLMTDAVFGCVQFTQKEE